jgi:hypothetical protein
MAGYREIALLCRVCLLVFHGVAPFPSLREGWAIRAVTVSTQRSDRTRCEHGEGAGKTEGDKQLLLFMCYNLCDACIPLLLLTELHFSTRPGPVQPLFAFDGLALPKHYCRDHYGVDRRVQRCIPVVAWRRVRHGATKKLKPVLDRISLLTVIFVFLRSIFLAILTSRVPPSSC